MGATLDTGQRTPPHGDALLPRRRRRPRLGVPITGVTITMHAPPPDAPFSPGGFAGATAAAAAERGGLA